MLLNLGELDKIKECVKKIQMAYAALEDYIEEMLEAATTTAEIEECEAYLTEDRAKCSTAFHSVLPRINPQKPKVASVKKEEEHQLEAKSEGEQASNATVIASIEIAAL